MSEFNIGEVLQLKSGSEDMTYVRDTENGDAVCSWRDKNGTDRTETYAKSF